MGQDGSGWEAGVTMPIDPETGKRLPGRPTRAERQAELMAQTQQFLREATSGISDAIRGVGPEPEKREPTATEQLAALRDLRHRSNGPIVPRPSVLTRESVRTWLRQVADIGSPGDVEIAWHAFSDATLKKRLLPEYERIRASAGPRYGALADAARKEQDGVRQGQQLRAAADKLAKEILHDQAKLAEKRRLLETVQG